MAWKNHGYKMGVCDPSTYGPPSPGMTPCSKSSGERVFLEIERIDTQKLHFFFKTGLKKPLSNMLDPFGGPPAVVFLEFHTVPWKSKTTKE